ncbi:fungal hydrophobin domain-containing protein [Trichoderma novae-zelandiae]
MKLLAVTALLVAGSLAVPAGSYPPPPLPTYGDVPSGEVGYPPEYPTEYPTEYPPEYALEYPEYPPGPDGAVDGGYGDVPDDGQDDGDEPGDVPPPPSPPPPPPTDDNDDDDDENVPGTPEQPPTDGDGDPADGGDDGDDTVGGGDDGDGEDAGADLCPSGLYSNPQCCATSVLGLLDLDCTSPSKTPGDIEAFNEICANEGSKKAQCCVIPVAGQALLCQDVADE